MKKTKQTAEEKQLLRKIKSELVDLVLIYKGTAERIEKEDKEEIDELSAVHASERTEWKQEKSLLRKRLKTHVRLNLVLRVCLIALVGYQLWVVFS